MVEKKKVVVTVDPPATEAKSAGPRIVVNVPTKNLVKWWLKPSIKFA